MTIDPHSTDIPPAGKLRLQPWMLLPETVRLMDALTIVKDGAVVADMVPRFVGGCVRDALSNRAVHDIDIATPLKPEEVIVELTKNGIGHVPTGLKHGTVTALVDGKPFEITTLRVDVLTFGRHADVKFTDDWKTDAARRDFTINAMSCDMDGNVYDYFGGMEDLRLGRVRFVGDAAKRINEDVLRILRYFRFLAHFGRGKPDSAAIHACQSAAIELRKLSGERVRQEVLKLLEARDCAAVWHLMLQGGVVTHILPEATDWQRLDQLVEIEAHFEVPAFALRRLAALMVVTPEGLKHAVHGLRLSSAQATQLFAMNTYADVLGVQTTAADLKRLVYHQGNDMAMNLLLLAWARLGDMPPREMFDLVISYRPPLFPLTGQDAMNTGLARGPDIGQVLAGVEAWWLAGDMQADRDACLAQLKLHAAAVLSRG